MAVKQILTGLLAVAALANTAPVDSVDTNEIEQHASIFKRNSWGPAVSTGPTKANIVSANYIFTPGQMPINQTGGLYLWAGMAGDGNSDLIQSIIGSQTSNSWCGATGKEWCLSSEVYSSTLGQIGGVLHSGGDGYRPLNITYTHINSTHWQQTIVDVMTQTLKASFLHASGAMKGFGTAVECNGGCTPTVATSYYDNVTVVLDAKDMTYGKTIGAGQGASYESFTTSDKGKTWHIEGIVIPAMNPFIEIDTVGA